MIKYGLTILFSSATYASITFGMMNNFQSETVEGWWHSPFSPFLPSVVADDGSAGVGDFSLWIRGHGAGGTGSR